MVSIKKFKNNDFYKLFIGILITSLPIATQSFGYHKTLSKTMIYNLHPLSHKRVSNIQQKRHFKAPSAKLWFSSDNKYNNQDDDGGKKNPSSLGIPEIDEKDIPGLMFVLILSLWHFLIGPALRPIILEMRG